MCLYDDFLCCIYKFGCFRTYRNKVATAKFIPWPIEIRFCEPSPSTNQTKSPPRLAGCSLLIFAYIYTSIICYFLWKIWKEDKGKLQCTFRNAANPLLSFLCKSFSHSLFGILYGTAYLLNLFKI